MMAMFASYNQREKSELKVTHQKIWKSKKNKK